MEIVQNGTQLRPTQSHKVTKKLQSCKGPQESYQVKGKDVTVTIKPVKDGSGCKRSPLVREKFEMMGLTDYEISDSDNSLSCVRSVDKALSKNKNKSSFPIYF